MQDDVCAHGQAAELREAARGAASRPLEVLSSGKGFSYGLTWVAGAVASGEPAGSDLDRSTLSAAQTVRADFVFVEASSPGAAARAAALKAEGIEPAWAVCGPFVRVARERGWASVMRDSLKDPRGVCGAVRAAMRSVLEATGLGVSVGARAFVLADEIATSAGWLVDPAFVRRDLVRMYRPFVEAVEAAGGFAMLHSDGDVSDEAASLAGTGFRAVHGASGGMTSGAARRLRAAGIVPAGGVAVVTARSCLAEAVDAASAAMMEGPMLVCDDGAISSPEDVAVVGRVLAELRMRTS